jgi:hypothetical protein
VRREKFLWPLTQSHHRGLVAAKDTRERIARMDPAGREREMAALREELKGFWESELKAHFGAEERMLEAFAARVGPSDADIQRTVRDHRTLEKLLHQGFKEDLLRFAELLTAHIRFEEEVLFGRIEAALAPPEAQSVGAMLLKAASPSCAKLPAPKKGRRTQ